MAANRIGRGYCPICALDPCVEHPVHKYVVYAMGSNSESFDYVGLDLEAAVVAYNRAKRNAPAPPRIAAYVSPGSSEFCGTQSAFMSGETADMWHCPHEPKRQL